MKIKLLKKIRKRFSITYYSKEISLWDSTYYGQCMVLQDSHSEYRNKYVEICTPDKYQNFFSDQALTKEDAKNLLLAKLIKWIKQDYRHTRKTKQTIEKIWYK